MTTPLTDKESVDRMKEIENRLVTDSCYVHAKADIEYLLSRLKAAEELAEAAHKYMVARKHTYHSIQGRENIEHAEYAACDAMDTLFFLLESRTPATSSEGEK